MHLNGTGKLFLAALAARVGTALYERSAAGRGRPAAPQGMDPRLHSLLLDAAGRGDGDAFDRALSSWGCPAGAVRINLWRWYAR